MMRKLAKGLLGLLLAGVVAGAAAPADAQIRLNAAYGDGSLQGPGKARGAVVWSHGRAVEYEDSTAPTPIYMQALRDAGWDVYRLDRMRVSDTLPNSSRALAEHAEQLKSRGYQRVVLTGQSFGAFISLLAAGRTETIDAVVGTAPAAFGNFSEAYDSYRDNATQLWPILRNVRSARVMLYFFHGDDFDPGGRGEQARTILAGRGIDNVIIDQPASLTGHGAANSGLFVRRFGSCIIRFAEAPPKAGDPPCDEAWGRSPSPGLLQANAGSAPTSTPQPGKPGSLGPFLGTWYGTYINGREVMLRVQRGEGDNASADYVLGPGVEADQGLEHVRRKGRVVEDELVFDEKGRNVLRYYLRPDGKLAATWLDKAGKGRLDTVLRRVD
ncbi:MAG TPA: alpha/beta hydrolase [Azospirillum sp.]|nr:alpha/beta hydrolase [Azospirillum sp.]